MNRSALWKLGCLAGLFALLWLCLRFALPLTLPFLLGAGLALMAEPVVELLSRFLPRAAGAVLGVSATLLLLLTVLVLVGSFAVRELGLLAQILPDLEQTALQGLTSLEHFLLTLAARTPDGIRSLLTKIILGFFSGGTAVVDQLAVRLPAMVSGFLSHVPDGFLMVGTGLLSAFLISGRLPRLRIWLKAHTPAFLRRMLPALRSLRTALAGWFKAQCKLAGMTYCIVTLGFLLLQVPYGPVWALVVALVDAIPLLGTGVVLLPWSLISLVQGNHFQSLGLLGIYAAAALTRSMLEPRLVGKQLGLDPLVTLFALYAGYQLWGIGGMLLSPMIAVAALQLANATSQGSADK